MTTVVGEIAVRVRPDTDEFRGQLRRLLQRVEKEVRGTVQVDAQLDSTSLRSNFAGMMTKLRTDAARGIRIKARVDERQLAPLGKFLGNIGKTTVNALTGALTKVTDLAASSGRGLLLVAGVAMLLPPALALVSGALAGIPALLAAVVVPAAAVALGMDGMKEAAKRLQPEFDSLKTTMNAIAESSFAPVFERLKPVFNGLQKTLPKVTEGLATMAQGFVDAVTSKSGLTAIDTTVANIGKALETAAPGVRDFTDGLLNLTSKVSGRLPGLARMFGEFSSKFSKWVDRITTIDSSGSSPLDRAMTGLRDTLQSILDLSKDLTTQGFDFLANSNVGQKIKDLVDGCNKLLTETLPDLNKAFEKIADTVAGIANNWNKIEWAANPLGKIAENQPQVPGIPKIDAGSSGIEVFLADLKIAEKAWGALKPKLLNGVREVSIGLTTMLSDIGIGTTNAVNTIANGANTAWQNLIAGAKNIGPSFSEALSSLGGIATTAWNSLVTAASTALAQTLIAVTTGAAQVVGEITTWPGKFLAALGDLGSTFFTSGQSLVQGFIDGVKSKISGAYDAVKSMMLSISNLIPHSPALEGPFSGSGWTFFSGQSIAEGLADGIGSMEHLAINAMEKMMKDISDTQQKYIDTMNDAVKIPVEMGKAIANQGMSDLGIGGGAITNGIGAGMDYLSQLGSNMGNGTNYTFNVSNIDEAMAVQKREESKQAMGIAGPMWRNG